MNQSEPLGPMVVRVLTERAGGALDWTVGAERPDGFGGQIIRMFVTDMGVEIYTRGTDPAGRLLFCRHVAPWARLVSVDEMMTEEVFAQEIAAAQLDAESDDEDADETESEAARPVAQRTGT